MANHKHDRDAFNAFNKFAYYAIRTDLHQRLSANPDILQIAAARVREYWEIDRDAGSSGHGARERVEWLVMHLDAASGDDGTVRLKHPVVLYDFIEHHGIRSAFAAHYIAAAPLIAHSFGAVLRATTDVRLLDVEEISRLLEAGWLEGRERRRQEDLRVMPTSDKPDRHAEQGQTTVGDEDPWWGVRNLIEADRYRDALVAVEEGIGRMPKDEEGYLLKAGILELLGRFDDARVEYEQSLQRFPGSKDVYLSLIELHSLLAERSSLANLASGSPSSNSEEHDR